jgi:hypothetical protein
VRKQQSARKSLPYLYLALGYSEYLMEIIHCLIRHVYIAGGGGGGGGGGG